ncbi:MAG: hypothetical protein ACKOK7_00700, partial [Solirubrobacterales bacterium]
MNALLAGAGTAFGLLAAADLLAAVARPASFGVVAAALRPASAAARRGRDASRSERAGLGALMGLAAFVAFSLAARLRSSASPAPRSRPSRQRVARSASSVDTWCETAPSAAARSSAAT